MQPAIKIESLTVTYPSRRGPVKALRGLSLTVPSNQVVGFLGPNGAGKTTTIHALLGFVQPTSGRARLLGEDVSKFVARKRLGYLPEGFS